MTQITAITKFSLLTKMSLFAVVSKIFHICVKGADKPFVSRAKHLINVKFYPVKEKYLKHEL